MRLALLFTLLVTPFRASACSCWGTTPIGVMFVAADAGTFSDGGGIPRDRLIEMVQRRFNARVVRVNLVESGGRRVYEMRLMSDQRVWNVRVDADTGQVLDGG